MAEINLSESQWLLITMVINNLIRETFNRIKDMTDDEVKNELVKEKYRNTALMNELLNH